METPPSGSRVRSAATDTATCTSALYAAPPPLAQLLREKGVRRVDVAAVSGVDLKTVHRICRGEHAGLKVGTLIRVAVALGVRPCDLVPVLHAPSDFQGLLRGGRPRWLPHRGASSI